MNDFQVRKQQKQQSMATKVTDPKMSENVPMGERPAATNVEEKCTSSLNAGRELIDQYPDITTEELHERLALWELNNKKNIGKPAQRIEAPVAPIKPKESAKHAIYGQNEQMNVTHGKASKRNEGTFSLGDGYNYFKDQSNGRK